MGLDEKRQNCKKDVFDRNVKIIIILALFVFM